MALDIHVLNLFSIYHPCIGLSINTFCTNLVHTAAPVALQINGDINIAERFQTGCYLLFSLHNEWQILRQHFYAGQMLMLPDTQLPDAE